MAEGNTSAGKDDYPELRGILQSMVNQQTSERGPDGRLTDAAVEATRKQMARMNVSGGTPPAVDPTNERGPDGLLTEAAVQAAQERTANMIGGTAPSPNPANERGPDGLLTPAAVEAAQQQMAGMNLSPGPGDVDVAQAAGAARRTLDAAYGAGGTPQPPAPTAR